MKKLLAAALLAAMLASVAACGKTADAAEGNYIYGQIDSITGNDIVLLLADYNAQSDAEEEQKDDPADDASGEEKGDRKRPERPKDGEKPEGFDPENLPEGFDPSQFKDGEMPEGFDPSQFKDGERPERPENGEMPEGFDPSQFKGKFPGGSNSRYPLTGEQEELRIPVGTPVTTAAGVETDFSVLTAGDIIKCSVTTDQDGQEIVTAIWIMEE